MSPCRSAATVCPSAATSRPSAGDARPTRRIDLRPVAPRGEPLPQRSGTAFEPLPQRGDSLPQRGDSLPQRGDSLPQRVTPCHSGVTPCHSAGPQQTGAEPLPRRTTRTRPAGRHRSPHRLSVASDAPSLVIAVPGTAEQDSAGVGHKVAAIAELSCPGVDIRVGYLDGYAQALFEVIDEGTESDGHEQFPSVIVPLLISPSPRVDDALRRIAAQPAVPAVVAAHLGPHPLLAEALHARLAELASPATPGRRG